MKVFLDCATSSEVSEGATRSEAIEDSTGTKEAYVFAYILISAKLPTSFDI